MTIDYTKFRAFCVTPGQENSNKANSYVQAVKILLDFLNIKDNSINDNDMDRIRSYKDIIRSRNSDEYQSILQFVTSRNQKSYLENGFISASINYLNDYYITNNAQESKIVKNKDENIYSKRYRTSLLAKPFVILTGNSGTGKTRIATNFSKYLEMKNDKGVKNHLLIPVGADWTDNTKILGFYNPLKKEYQSTPVLDFILLTCQNPEIPFFLILDEMNLSHVERYFSDFLSAMESGEPIPLYKRDVDCESSIPEEIVLPNNLFVTGTVNIDETTYMFSPKVLDRQTSLSSNRTCLMY